MVALSSIGFRFGLLGFRHSFCKDTFFWITSKTADLIRSAVSHYKVMKKRFTVKLGRDSLREIADSTKSMESGVKLSSGGWHGLPEAAVAGRR